MPSKHIWVREEDLPAWEAIKDKPRWVHESLNPADGTPKSVSIRLTKKDLVSEVMLEPSEPSA